MMIRVARPGSAIVRLVIIVVLSTTSPAVTETEPAVPVCAVLADPALQTHESSLTALLEVKLSRSGTVRLVERAELEKVLREQTLRLAFSPEGGGRRRDLGRLLRADALVLLRPAAGEAESPKSLELIVCETRMGLRLCVETVAVTTDADGVAEVVVLAVRRALTRHAAGIREICAVPPFVGRDFKHDFDYLQTAYGRVVEQELMDSPGLAVVELAEARAIADEMRLAGDPSGAIRRLPLYLLGEYENHGTGEGRTASISLRLKRGEDLLASAEKEMLPPGEAGSFLRIAATRLLAEQGSGGPAMHDVEAEVRQLNSRAGTYARIGMWQESLDLIEASLLLKPDQPDLHRDAVAALNRIIPGLYNAKIPKLRGEGRMEKAFACYRLGLRHEAEWLEARWPAAGANVGIRGIVDRVEWVDWLAEPPQPSELCAQVRQEDRDATIRRLEAHATAGELNVSLLFTIAMRLFHEERGVYEDRLRVIRLVPTKSRSAVETILFIAMHGLSMLQYDTPEFKTFLDQVAGLPDPVYATAVERIKERVHLYQVYSTPSADQEVSEVGDVELERIDVRRSDVPNAPILFSQSFAWLACGTGIDAIRWNHELFLMTRPGVLEPVYQWPRRSGPGMLCWDGKYLWFTVRKEENASLVAFEPRSRRMVELRNPGVLPPYTHGLLAAPVGPGRICMSGAFASPGTHAGPDRSWIGVATADDDRVLGVRMIHEARDQPTPDEASGKTAGLHAVFHPFQMAGLADPADPSRLRILLLRDSNRSRPLLIDPAGGNVRALDARIDSWFMMTPSPCTFYWVKEFGDSAPELWSVGWPDFEQKLLSRGLPGLGTMLVHEERLLLVTNQGWWSGGLDGRQFTPIKNGPFGMMQFAESSHYGLVALHAGRVHKVRFHKGSMSQPGE